MLARTTFVSTIPRAEIQSTCVANRMRSCTDKSIDLFPARRLLGLHDHIEPRGEPSCVLWYVGTLVCCPPRLVSSVVLFGYTYVCMQLLLCCLDAKHCLKRRRVLAKPGTVKGHPCWARRRDRSVDFSATTTWTTALPRAAVSPAAVVGWAVCILRRYTMHYTTTLWFRHIPRQRYKRPSQLMLWSVLWMEFRRLQ